MTLAIYGPTATGKTALGIKLAQKLNGEIISADSRQVYKGLDIGTGKVSPGAKCEKHHGYWIVEGVKIRGFDLVEPGESFTVADFLGFANKTLKSIAQKNKLPIIIGGTGFYIKALLDGIDTIGIKPNLKLREQLEKLYANDLYQKLLSLDPEKAKSLNQSDHANPRRLIRAIEIAYAVMLTPDVRKVVSGHTSGVSQTNGKWQMANGKFLLIGLTAPNDYLYRRADNWIDTRIEHGMIEEVKNLLEVKIDPKWLDNLGLEYRWITRYLLGKITKTEAIQRLKGDIHSFIRRQKTWFKQFRGMLLYDISQPNWQTKLENDIILVDDRRQNLIQS